MVTDAFDLALMKTTIEDIREKKSVNLPKYDYKQNARFATLDYVFYFTVMHHKRKVENGSWSLLPTPS